MRVELDTGAIHEYTPVTRGEFSEMCAAESVGKAYAQLIRGKQALQLRLPRNQEIRVEGTGRAARVHLVSVSVKGAERKMESATMEELILAWRMMSKMFGDEAHDLFEVEHDSAIS